MKTAAQKTTANLIKFGTDGWRAVIGENFTFGNVERLAQAYADFINRRANSKLKGDAQTKPSLASTAGQFPLVIIGFDNRFLSDRFAQRTAEVLASNQIQTALFPRSVPTPVVSWAVQANAARTTCPETVGGVVITASHNSYSYNGFKIKAFWGGSASPEMTREIETLIEDHFPSPKSVLPPVETAVTDWGNQEIISDSIAGYRKRLTDFFDLERIKAFDSKIVIDSMHGSGARWTESFLKPARQLKVETIRGDRNPLFGGVNPEPIDSNLGKLKKRILKTGALLGLATDGDADRLGAVNENGETMPMHQVAPLLLLHLIRRKRMSGAVVQTFSQSLLNRRIARAYKLPFYETRIGFKYIADLMLERDVLIGAEESGGIGIKGHLPERDGIFNSLLLLEAVSESGKKPSQLIDEIHREFGKTYFDRQDIPFEVRRGEDFVKSLTSQNEARLFDEEICRIENLDGTKLIFRDESWLLFRQSGTEPVLRIYCEGISLVKMQGLLTAGVELARKF